MLEAAEKGVNRRRIDKRRPNRGAPEHLEKGRPVAIQGRLDWRSYEAKDGSGKREAVQIIADTVQFPNARPKDEDVQSEFEESREPVGAAAGAEGAEDDIPF